MLTWDEPEEGPKQRTLGALLREREGGRSRGGPDATIGRVETDADGNAAYEAHVVKTDATPATVYVDKQFDVVSVESR